LLYGDCELGFSIFRRRQLTDQTVVVGAIGACCAQSFLPDKIVARRLLFTCPAEFTTLLPLLSGNAMGRGADAGREADRWPRVDW
jgi:hypothetical protein